MKRKFAWIKKPSSQTLQQTLRDLDGAYQNFFKGETKYPKPKKKQTSGIRLPAPASIKVVPFESKKKGKVELPKIEILKFRKSREVAGEFRSCAISKQPHGEFSLSFLCRLEMVRCIYNRSGSCYESTYILHVHQVSYFATRVFGS